MWHDDVNFAPLIHNLVVENQTDVAGFVVFLSNISINAIIRILGLVSLHAISSFYTFTFLSLGWMKLKRHKKMVVVTMVCIKAHYGIFFH